MAITKMQPAGGYRFVEGGGPYSLGVASLPGFGLERVTLRRPCPLAQGLEFIRSYLNAAGRSPAALAACELRSPAPLTRAEFEAFNRDYLDHLNALGFPIGDSCPIARTNVCLLEGAVAEPSIHAFSYTVPAGPTALPNFVISGSAELRTSSGQVIALHDTSPTGLHAKAVSVLREIERRLAALDVRWSDASAVSAYTAFDLPPLVMQEFRASGAACHSLTLLASRPPVQDLDFEIDCRCVSIERLV